ncbi:MAG: DNA repair protein RecO [Bacteroidales bacterium]|nr:DNA repair protein RecO [Bacteroidales bacterium]
MLHKTRGIVLHQINYSETSVIAKIYTEQFGLQSYIIRGVRKAKSKIKRNLLQHLSPVDMVVYYKGKSNIQYIKEIKTDFQLQSIPFEITKSSIAIFINEILYKSIKEEEANPKLFEFIFNSVKLLDETKDKYINFHLLFVIQLTKFLGFFPRGNYSTSKTFFDMEEGIFCGNKPMHGNYIREPLSRKFFNLLKTEIAENSSVSLSQKERQEFLQRLIDYYRLHLPVFREIKSHHILREVLE